MYVYNIYVCAYAHRLEGLYDLGMRDANILLECLMFGGGNPWP